MMARLLDPNNIIIIGNGPSVQNYNFGKQIDQYNYVARINNFKTDGYEKIIGSKTNIWCNGANQNLYRRREQFDRILVFIPPTILDFNKKSIHKRIKKRLNVSRDDYELISIDKMKNFEKKCDCYRLTTGTNSILWAVENFEKVIIHGFDFFQNGKEHYFDNKLKKWLFNQNWLKKGEKHNLIQEKRYIDKLIKKGDVIQLKDMDFVN